MRKLTEIASRDWEAVANAFGVCGMVAVGLAMELDALAATLPLAHTSPLLRGEANLLLVLVGSYLVGAMVREWRLRHLPNRARAARYQGWAVQALITAAAALNGVAGGNLWPLVGVVVGQRIAMWPWHLWVKAMSPLAAEQQAINALIAEHEHAVALIARRQLPQRPNWTVPTGKHHPVVYFIRNGNRIKIGTTTDLRNRVRRLALRTDNIALVLRGDATAERALHHRFADLRVGNTEWFHAAKTLENFIAEQNALVLTNAGG